MAKPQFQVSILSYGIHTQWDASSKSLPKVKQFTEQIPAELDIEFGLIINVKKAKGQKIRYCIYHPNIPDENGQIMAPFDGEEYVRSNDWDFYLGDTIWSPIDNKIGDWRMTIELNGDVIADKTFEIVPATQPEHHSMWPK